jgi:hypothetical protein
MRNLLLSLSTLLYFWGLSLGGEPALKIRFSSTPMRPGAYVVSPDGPRDGGDFGPHTPGTKTSGLQEAFNACKRDRKDLTILGGAVPQAFQNPGGVYFLHTTLRIPWMQDFRCDGGEAVLQYTPPTGDAIVMDSQMSCLYKFGLIVLRQGQADGACLRVQPQTAGPDRLVGVVASRFSINACVGGGSLGLEKEITGGLGDGLVLDASKGGITHNEFHLHEVLACRRGIYFTSPRPTSGVVNNWLRCPFVHICQTHLRLGDPGKDSGVLWNRIEALVDSQDLKDSIGAQIYGRGNRLALSFIRVHTGVVFEPGAAENLVETQNLVGRFADNARASTNRIRTQERDGLGVKTPAFPESGRWLENPYPATVEVTVLAPGEVSSWQREEKGRPGLRFEGKLYAGQTFTLKPFERVSFDYSRVPAWHWRVLE